MKRRPRRKRAAQARDLALAIFSATDADDVRMQRVIDRHVTHALNAADGNLSLRPIYSACTDGRCSATCDVRARTRHGDGAQLLARAC